LAPLLLWLLRRRRRSDIIPPIRAQNISGAAMMSGSRNRPGGGNMCTITVRKNLRGAPAELA
jgi:hypothetical protein